MGAHLIGGQFQSDKYPSTPRGKVPLSVKDPTAHDLLWEYAQRRRSVDAEFSDDLEEALRLAGYQGPTTERWDAAAKAEGRREGLLAAIEEIDGLMSDGCDQSGNAIPADCHECVAALRALLPPAHSEAKEPADG